MRESCRDSAQKAARHAKRPGPSFSKATAAYMKTEKWGRVLQRMPCRWLCKHKDRRACDMSAGHTFADSIDRDDSTLLLPNAQRSCRCLLHQTHRRAQRPQSNGLDRHLEVYSSAKTGKSVLEKSNPTCRLSTRSNRSKMPRRPPAKG